MLSREYLRNSATIMFLALLFLGSTDQALGQDAIAITSPGLPIVFVDPEKPSPVTSQGPRPQLDLSAKKNWTADERQRVTEHFRQLGAKGAGLLRRATAYRRLTLYRANFPSGEGPFAFASLGGANSITFADAYFSSDQPTTTLAHELTHLADYGLMDAGSPEWKRLAGPPCERIRNKIAAERNIRLTYALTNDQWRDLGAAYGSFARQQGMPSVYACVNLADAMAEVVELAMAGDSMPDAPAIAAFVQQRYLSQGYKPQQRFQDYFDAIALVESGKLDEAIAAFTRQLAVFPEFDELYSQRSRARLVKGDRGGALDDLDKAIQGSLKISDSFNAAQRSAVRGNILLRQKDYQGAEAAYTRSIEYLPGWIDFLFERARLREEDVNDSDGAIADCTEILKLRPESVPALLMRAKAFGKKKDYAKMDADFSRAIQLAPEFVEAYFDRATSRMERSMFKEAVSDFTAVINIQGRSSTPDYWFDYQSLFNRGKAQEELGQFLAAIADYTTLIQMAKKWAVFPVAAYHEARGIAYVKAGEFAKGLEDLRIGQRDSSRAAALAPWIQKATGQVADQYRKAAEQGEAQAQFNLGWMYYTGQGVTQDYRQAADWYHKAAEQGLSIAQYNLGLMYGTGQGVTQDYIEAHKWWNIAGNGGNAGGIKNREIVEKMMTPDQIAEAQQRTSAWMKAHH
ncbi:MAG TPA: tetratricopeptide repeat protein [Novimethylophilus sp.]|jgi:tetratricopeptide (TPR) repeat protein|uniref:tetratricopeptide repeat protein n=1 Tax=Novimethylophilus sp. TaxID=2137426 RepID=UPI002F3F6D8B